jgi:hypothetical protein
LASAVHAADRGRRRQKGRIANEISTVHNRFAGEERLLSLVAGTRRVPNTLMASSERLCCRHPIPPTRLGTRLILRALVLREQFGGAVIDGDALSRGLFPVAVVFVPRRGVFSIFLYPFDFGKLGNNRTQARRGSAAVSSRSRRQSLDGFAAFSQTRGHVTRQSLHFPGHPAGVARTAVVPPRPT